MEPGWRIRGFFSLFTSEMFQWRKENPWLFVQKN